MNNREKRGLGRGLSALMADVAVAPGVDRPTGGRGEQMVPIEQVAPNPEQPRRHFSEEALSELAASVAEKGILQPLIVREIASDTAKYQIVAGERRWRAAQRAQLHEVPVIIRQFSDVEVLEIAIIENIQRADLNAIEEAAGYRQLMDRFGHTQEKLAESLGKSRSHIANLLRLLQLPQEIRDYVVEGKLTAGHARALITCDDPVTLARKAVVGGLSVRETERMAKAASEPRAPRINGANGHARETDADTRALEGDLSANLGMKVMIEHKPNGQSGRVVIEYRDLDELDDLCRLLTLTRTGASI